MHVHICSEVCMEREERALVNEILPYVAMRKCLTVSYMDNKDIVARISSLEEKLSCLGKALDEVLKELEGLKSECLTAGEEQNTRALDPQPASERHDAVGGSTDIQRVDAESYMTENQSSEEMPPAVGNTTQSDIQRDSEALEDAQQNGSHADVTEDLPEGDDQPDIPDYLLDVSDVSSVERGYFATEEPPVKTSEDEGPTLFSEEEHSKDKMDINQAASRKSRKAVMDVHSGTPAWLTDRPGSPVKDIRSAISLNDRILFIDVLFKGDSAMYHSAASLINGMSSIDEVKAYVEEQFPDWNMNSDAVYRFMMAVRRKVR